MADNYNMFSEMIEAITPEEAAWITALLDNHGDGLTGDALKTWCEERGLEYFNDDQAIPEYLEYWPRV